MMKYILILFLTRFAVMCVKASSSINFVVNKPEDDPPSDKKPFRVYWNVPTMQCTSKKIPFTNLAKFGIIQNKGDVFKGDRVTILYDPGLFPAIITKNGSWLRNGGVPQEGDIKIHIKKLKNDIEKDITDPDFDGIGIIDFEDWRPVFRQNYGNLVAQKELSYEIERKRHWWWPKAWIQAQATKRFEVAAREFMQTSISIAKQMRPKALWGYYGFPYCFNSGMTENCSDDTKNENTNMYWMWSESTALYPSVYSSKNLTSSQLVTLVRGRVKEAARVRSPWTPILPYFWFRYRDGGYFSEMDLNAVLKEFYNSDASGFIIWGGSDDVNTPQKCKDLLAYVEDVLGPAIAKYTKYTVENDTPLVTDPDSTSLNDTVVIDVNISVKLSEKAVSSIYGKTNIQFILDPEQHIQPPENYSQAISYYVRQPGNNALVNDTNPKNLNDSVLLDIIASSILHQPVNMDTNSTPENGISNNVSGIDIKTQNITEDTLINVTGDDSATASIIKYLSHTTANVDNYSSTENYLSNDINAINSASQNETGVTINITDDDSATLFIIKYLLDRDTTYLTSIATSNPFDRLTTYYDLDSSTASPASSKADEQTTESLKTTQNTTVFSTESVDKNIVRQNNDTEASQFVNTTEYLILVTNITDSDNGSTEKSIHLRTTEFVTNTKVDESSKSTKYTTAAPNFEKNKNIYGVKGSSDSEYVFETESTTSQIIKENETLYDRSDSITDITDGTTEFLTSVTNKSPNDSDNIPSTVADKDATVIAIDYTDAINDEFSTSTSTEYETVSTENESNLMNRDFYASSTLIEDNTESTEFVTIITDIEGISISTESITSSSNPEDNSHNNKFLTDSTKVENNFETTEFVTGTQVTEGMSNSTNYLSSSFDLEENLESDQFSTSSRTDEDNVETTEFVTDRSLSTQSTAANFDVEGNLETVTDRNEASEPASTNKSEDLQENNSTKLSLTTELEQVVVYMVNLIP